MRALMILGVAAAIGASFGTTNAVMGGALWGSGAVEAVPGQVSDKMPVGLFNYPNFPEMKVRDEIANQTNYLIAHREFTALDKMEEEFRTSRARTPSGVWKLSKMYDTLYERLANPSPQMNCAMDEATVEAWLEASPSSPLPHLLHAEQLSSRAWCYRGQGTASSVADDAWPKFRYGIDRAISYLEANKSVASVDPNYYATMLGLYRSQGRSDAEFQAVLDEGTRREPYYYRIYNASFTHYLPQWGGSAEKVDEGARYAIDRTQSEERTGVYARYYWDPILRNCDCWRDSIDWPTMVTSMHDLADRYPDPWNLAHFAKFACVYGDAKTAREYFDRLGKRDVHDAWPTRAGYSACRQFAGA